MVLLDKERPSAMPPDDTLSAEDRLHVRVHRVDADGKALSDKLFDHRQHTSRLHTGVDAGGARSRRLTADIDDRGTVGGKCHSVFDGPITIEK